jgi:hypothetical protein
MQNTAQRHLTFSPDTYAPSANNSAYRRSPFQPLALSGKFLEYDRGTAGEKTVRLQINSNPCLN